MTSYGGQSFRSSERIVGLIPTLGYPTRASVGLEALVKKRLPRALETWLDSPFPGVAESPRFGCGANGSMHAAPPHPTPRTGKIGWSNPSHDDRAKCHEGGVSLPCMQAVTLN